MCKQKDLQNASDVAHSGHGVVFRAQTGSAGRGAAAARTDGGANAVCDAALAGNIGKYETSCDRLLATIAEAENLRTPLRYAHPWFGPLDAAGWHAMTGMHLTIHRVQIERIVGALKARARNSA